MLDIRTYKHTLLLMQGAFEAFKHELECIPQSYSCVSSHLQAMKIYRIRSKTKMLQPTLLFHRTQCETRAEGICRNGRTCFDFLKTKCLLGL